MPEGPYMKEAEEVGKKINYASREACVLCHEIVM